ncbi:hypothetical protein AQJ23_17020 [Streptomyces antibioticus]|nr:hypothetical protein AQJ23_17020 [Streptomyces antibioticus]
MVADLDVGDLRAHRFHDPSPLVAEDHGRYADRALPALDVQFGVAECGRLDLEHDFGGAGVVQGDGFDAEESVGAAEDGRAGLGHGASIPATGCCRRERESVTVRAVGRIVVTCKANSDSMY